MLTLDTLVHFTWFWNRDFFLETPVGNFLWSDPEYPGGNNTIVPCDMTYQDFCKKVNCEFGRDKGKRTIRQYCGDQVVITQYSEKPKTEFKGWPE